MAGPGRPRSRATYPGTVLPHRLLLALCGGVALLLAFPGYDAWPLALVGCGALALGRTLQLLFRGVDVGHAPTYAGVAVLLAGVAAAASLFPARRAARVDPAVALRAE